MRISHSVFLASLFITSPLWADDHSQHHAMTPPPAAASAEYQSSGTVRQWGPDSVTLSHAAIPALRWPAMTMAFALPAAHKLTPLPVGAAVDFRFVRSDAGYTLTAIDAQHK